MWWSSPAARPGRRVAGAALVALALAGCGFQPLYGPRQAALRPELSAIRIAPIRDRIGQQLRNLLAARLAPRGEAARPRYLLTVSLNRTITKLGVRKNTTVTRANLTVQARYALSRLADGRPLVSGHSRATTSYDIVLSPYATLVAEADAERRALEVIGEDIALRLSFYFAGRPAGPPRAAGRPAGGAG